MSQIEYPPGWDDAKVRKVLKYYEKSTKKKLSQKMRPL